MNTTPDKLPELPEGYALYGKGPLKVLNKDGGDDVMRWDPGWGADSDWDSWEWTGELNYGFYALRIGSEIWKANGMEKKYRMLEVGEVFEEGDEVAIDSVWIDLPPVHFGKRVEDESSGPFPVGYYRRPVEKLLLIADEVGDLQAAVSSPAYKQLEGEFIQQRDELAAARNRIVELERERNGLAVELNSAKDEAVRQFNKVQVLTKDLATHGSILGGISDLLGLPKTDIIDTGNIHKAIWELKEGKDDLQRRIVAEAEEAAQRIISLEDECGRLHKLWHEAQVKVDVLESEKKVMIEAKGFIVAGPSDDLSEVSKLVCAKADLESRLNASVQSLITKDADLFAYGDFTAKIAKLLGIPVMEISLNEVLLRVKELVAAKSDLSTDVLLRRIDESARERDGWEQTAAQHLRNEQFYRDLLGQCAELLGDECRRSDDGKLIPKGDFLALKVPEVLRTKLEHSKMLTADYNTRTELGHSLFGADGPFHGALTIGQDVVLDGMKWMAREIGILRSVEDHKPFIRKLVATELGKATNNILKGL